MIYDRFTTCLLALLAGFFFAQMSPLPAVIGLTICAWILIAALLPEKKEPTHEDHRARPSP